MENTNLKIRNVAIIAHVDHGKTTIVDAILKQSNIFRSNENEMAQEQILDTGDLEREKGITISAKNISVEYKDFKINIIDTPGHADFGGEVERTLNMAEGCVLVVDAQEGPMIQTRVVLRKALEIGLRPIVVVNKIDKKLADVKLTVSRIQDLFLELAQDESQLDFPIFYAVARDGKIFSDLPDEAPDNLGPIEGDVSPLLDEILTYVPETTGDREGDFQMMISSLEYDKHNGRYLIGKVSRGTVKIGDPLTVVSAIDADLKEKGRVKKLLVRKGLSFVEVKETTVGEIVGIIGIESTKIGSTLCSNSNLEALPEIDISPPSIEVKIEANTSPFVGQEGEHVTARLLKRRLDRENDLNVSLDIETNDGGSNTVRVRGELQLGILLETLRREGFECQVRKPSIINQMIDGKMMEPLEEVNIEVPEEFASEIIQELTHREAELVDMKNEDGKTVFDYKILTRKLLGLRNYLVAVTKGSLLFNTAFLEYTPVRKTKEEVKKGSIISMAAGESRDYSLNTIQDRGDLFISGSNPVYEGMIIGRSKNDKDMEVNPTKERQKTAVRMNRAEITLTSLKPPIRLTLDSALEFLSDEDMLEVTPKNLRLRKIHLSKKERDWSKRKNLTDFAMKQMNSK